MRLVYLNIGFCMIVITSISEFSRSGLGWKVSGKVGIDVRVGS